LPLRRKQPQQWGWLMNVLGILRFTEVLTRVYWQLAQLCYDRHLLGWGCNFGYSLEQREFRAETAAVLARIEDEELQTAYAGLATAMEHLAVIDQRITEWLVDFTAPRFRGKRRTASLRQRLNFLEKSTDWSDWWAWAIQPEYQELRPHSEAAIIEVARQVAQVKARLRQLQALSPAEETARESRWNSISYAELNDDWIIESTEADALGAILGLVEHYYRELEVTRERHRAGQCSGLWFSIDDIGIRRYSRVLLRHISDDEVKSAWEDFRRILQGMAEVDRLIFQWLMVWTGMPSLTSLPVAPSMPGKYEMWDYARMKYRYHMIDQADPLNRDRRVAHPGYQALLSRSESAVEEATATKQRVDKRIHQLM